MNKEELNWLLQMIKDAKTAEHFVLAQYDHGRISSQVMMDVGQEWGWISRNANQVLTVTTRYSTELSIAIA